ncbi:Hypothetical predicted protein [Cloeon dipterum]|uniref:THAP-type domain-containing protein n=2 Tax=Cloeon dipterum TaxID=197152 RepID=A0A8S1CX28_9INSE|nr:Hypothetical predicted protein [Cloeon dipterum]
MPQCAIATCNNSHRKTKKDGIPDDPDDRISYHRIPSDPRVKIHWIAACGRDFNDKTSSSAVKRGKKDQPVINEENMRVCSKHFERRFFEIRPPTNPDPGKKEVPVRRLMRGSTPTLFVPVVVPSLVEEAKSWGPPQRATLRSGQDEKAGLVPAIKNMIGANAPNLMQPLKRLSISDSSATSSSLNSSGTSAESQEEFCEALGLRRNFLPGPVEPPHHLFNGLQVMQGMHPLNQAAQPPALEDGDEAAEEAAPQQELEGGEPSDSIISEETAARTGAAALVRVELDEGAKPLEFTAAGHISPPTEAGSSGGGTDDEEAPRMKPSSRLKRTLRQSSSESDAKLSRLSNGETIMDSRERQINAILDKARSPEEINRLIENTSREVESLTQVISSKLAELHSYISQKSLKSELLDKAQVRRLIPLPMKPRANGLQEQLPIGEGRQGPIIKATHIIATHRRNHPDEIPRQGRRMPRREHSSTTTSANSSTIALPTMDPNTNFQHILQGIALQSCIDNRMQSTVGPMSSQASRKLHSYPDVTLHQLPQQVNPATTPMLQKILTKMPGNTVMANNNSPTLMQLLTEPKKGGHQGDRLSEMPVPNQAADHNVSITDLLGSSKAHSELTITVTNPTTELSRKQGSSQRTVSILNYVYVFCRTDNFLSLVFLPAPNTLF